MKQYQKSLILFIAALALLLIARQSLALVWKVETVDGSTAVGFNTSLALDAQGRPHISYHDTTNESLKYARWDGTAWQIETVDTGDVGWYSSLKLDQQGRPHISYDQRKSGARYLKYAWWDGTAWQITEVDKAGQVGYETSLELDSNGLPHISYYDDTNTALKYAYYDGSSWHPTTVDNSGTVGFASSLALDSQNRPHITYFNSTSSALSYAHWDGSEWKIEIADDDGYVGNFSSLAIDGNDRPHIAYRDESNSSLKYAYWDGASWQYATVDNDGDTGRYPSLVLDIQGRPHISYHYSTELDLKYAWWDGTTWHSEVADSTGNAGQHSSLALDGEGRPHISSNGSIRLKYTIGREPTAVYYLSTTAAGTVDGINFGQEDILREEYGEWSLFFDGSAHGLKANQSINAFYSGNPEAADDLYLSFANKKTNIPGVNQMQRADIAHFNGSTFTPYFDGSDVGLTTASEGIDGLHILSGAAAPAIFGDSCQVYLLISTVGSGKVPAFGGGKLNFQGEDILGFCATSTGSTTAGGWVMVLDGSAKGMPKNSTDSISANEDGTVIYLTTAKAFNVDAAFGGHSMVYRYDAGSDNFSGPYFKAPANNLTQKVNGLHVGGKLP